MKDLVTAAKKKAHLALLQAQVEERERAKQAARVLKMSEGQAAKDALAKEKLLIEVLTQDANKTLHRLTQIYCLQMECSKIVNQRQRASHWESIFMQAC